MAKNASNPFSNVPYGVAIAIRDNLHHAEVIDVSEEPERHRYRVTCRGGVKASFPFVNYDIISVNSLGDNTQIIIQG